MKYAWFLVPALLAGCGTPTPLWTAQYSNTTTTRVYADVPPAKLLAAAEQVVSLTAPPRDVEIRATPTGAVADRYYVGMIGINSITADYTFNLTVAPAGSGSTLKLDIEQHIDGYTPGNDAMQPLPGPAQIQVADPYTLFFARVDYILGKRKDWVTCAAAPTTLGLTNSRALNPLCFGASSAPPPKATAAQG